MTLKKLAAGSGYEYLTEQVAAYDSTELGGIPLANYYATKGESPGRWTGSGLVGIKGMEKGDVVTAEQMQHLFGEGTDPETGAPLGRPFSEKSVAGFDLTFSPVKSVSALWAVAPPEVAAKIRAAHDGAVADALAFLETHAVFTREGSGGARQVDTRGLVGAAFVHRDSRAGDPDLHTHVAVANKVQTAEGKWLSIYGGVLYHHIVAASETYNTALEHHLRADLGLRFVELARADGKRPVREVDGVDPALIQLWSRRRGDIEHRLAELTSEFTDSHGRAPTMKESIALAQRANLETRDAKHEPRSDAEQRATWHAQAQHDLGPTFLDQMIEGAQQATNRRLPRPDAEWLDGAAARVVAELESHRATWQSWHVYAEAQRQVRDLDVTPDQLPGLVEQLAEAVMRSTINLTPELDPIGEPAALRRSDGTSVFRHTGGIQLNDGQRKLVRAMATDTRQVTLALAPAGSGKTTATKVLADAWTSLGYDVVGLTPSAAAAAVLRDATGVPTETMAKLDDLVSRGHPPEIIRARTLVVIDEAGMADTPTLDRVIAFCTRRGALVRLIGDDQQLAAVGAGGVLRDISTTHGAQRLEDVVRFTDPIEAQATTDLRSGDPAALGFYLDHDRIHTGDELTSLADVLTGWQDEQEAGRDCLMLAPTRELVARLNAAARNSRLDGMTSDKEVALRDGNHASIGDTILTRRNDRCLGVSGTDWVKNGDRWTITGVRDDGGLHVRHTSSHLQVVLPAEYVAADVELGYASTVHVAQGQTTDVMHGILTGDEDRQLLYTMPTRARAENHLHLIHEPADSNDEEQFLPGVHEQLTAVETLDRIITRDGAAVSATSELARNTDPATRLHDAVKRYADALRFATAKALGAGAEDALEAAGPGPLPWLPGIPAELSADMPLNAYLTARAARVTDLAARVRRHAHLSAAVERYTDVLTDQLRDEIAVWRAANGIDDDRSLLGPRSDDLATDRYARHLQRQIDALSAPEVRRWQEAIAQALGNPAHRSEATLDLARQLDRIQRSGINARQLLSRAVSARKPLPADHTVEALTYRVQRMADHQRRLNQVQLREPARRGPSLSL